MMNSNVFEDRQDLAKDAAAQEDNGMKGVIKAMEHDPSVNGMEIATAYKTSEQSAEQTSPAGAAEVAAAYKAVEHGVVDTYQKIEDGVVGTYKKIETGAVDTYTKVEDFFVDKFFAKEGESVEDAKKRLRGE